MAKYIKVYNVRKFVKAQGKQISKPLLHELDRRIEHMLLVACQQFNGHHKRLTPELLPRVK